MHTNKFIIHPDIVLNRSIFIILLIGFIAGIFSGCTIEFKTGQRENESEQKETIKETPQEESTVIQTGETRPYISITSNITIDYPLSWNISDKGDLIVFKPTPDSTFYVNIFRELNGNPDNRSIEDYVSNTIRPKYEGQVEYSDDNMEFYSIDGRSAFKLRNISQDNEPFDIVTILDSTTVYRVIFSSESVDPESYRSALALINSIAFPKAIDDQTDIQYQSYSNQGFVIVYPDSWIVASEGTEGSLLKLYYTSSSEKRDTAGGVEPDTAVIKVIKHEHKQLEDVKNKIIESLEEVSTNEISVFELTATEIVGKSWQPQYITLFVLPDTSIIEINTAYSSEALLPQLKNIVRSFHLKPQT